MDREYGWNVECGDEKGRITAARDRHDPLIDAIENNEPARAVEITLAHWELSRNEIELHVRPDPLPLDPRALEERKRNAI